MEIASVLDTFLLRKVSIDSSSCLRIWILPSSEEVLVLIESDLSGSPLLVEVWFGPDTVTESIEMDSGLGRGAEIAIPDDSDPEGPP